MPRGRPKKVQPEVVASIPVAQAETFHVETVPTAPKRELTPIEIRIQESREALKQPLGPGQVYFETPDGEIIIGEADRPHVWSRNMNGGHGGWANPRR